MTEVFDDGDYGPVTLVWNLLKVLFALSPLIGMVFLFLFSFDTVQKEKEKRNAKFEFSMKGGED